MKHELRNLFSTPLWIFDIKSEDASLHDMIYYDGINFSNYVESERSRLDSLTFNTMHYNFLDFQGYGIEKLKNHVMNVINEIADDRGWTNYTIDTKSMHKVIKPNGNDTPHHHSDLDMIAVYYVKCPPKCGDILFMDTRGSVNLAWEDKFVSEDVSNYSYSKGGRVSHRITPEEGMLVVFPNYLFHMVETNFSNENRISIVVDIRLNLGDSLN